jgi:hypothetical protein
MAMVGQGPPYAAQHSKKDMARAEQFIGYDTTRCLRLTSKSIRDSWRHNGSCRQREALERQLVA